MKKILISAICLIASMNMYAQQDPMLSHYMFNHLVINPAYAGSKDYMSATAIYRKQWVNFDGAPTSQAVSLHGPFFDKKMGLGLSVIHDKIGITNRTDFFLDYAYHLKLNNNLKLGLGLQGGLSSYSTKFSELKIWDAGDQVFAQDKSNMLPNFGTGAYLYSKKFYLGLSVPHILSYDPDNALSIKSAKVVPHQVRHYFATAGVVIEASPDVVIKPSMLVKYVSQTPVEFDFNVNFLLANTFWIGGSYRTGDAIVGLIEINVTRQLRIGYSYDYTFTDINKFSSGSHEVMLGYDFGYDIMKIKTPRYF